MSGKEYIIYHNPRCSKSRETLELLQSNHIEPMIIEYLETPPGEQELNKIIEMLGVEAGDLLRTTEQAYKDSGLDQATPTKDEIISAICRHPILLQRPIVVSGDRAIIGRPPENVLKLIA